MRLEQIRDNVLSHLQRESGTTSHWTSSQIEFILNFIYRDLAYDFRNVKEVWQETSSTVVGEIYQIPENFITIEEVFWDNQLKDPNSIYEIRKMDDRWRERSGEPDFWCLDYREGFLLLWYFPSTAKTIKATGPVVPVNLEPQQSPSPPYADGAILEPLGVSFALSQEGPGQNLERSKFWFDIGNGKIYSLLKNKISSKDDALRSVDTYSSAVRGPRFPSNYPRMNWWNK